MNTKTQQSSKGMYIALAILLTIQSVPLLGMFLNSIFVLAIAGLIVSIIALYQSKYDQRKKAGPILGIFAFAMAIVSGVFMNELMYSFFYSDFEEFYLVFMFINWIVVVTGAVITYINAFSSSRNVQNPFLQQSAYNQPNNQGQMMGQPQQMNQGQMMGQPQQMNQGQMMGQPQQMNQGQMMGQPQQMNQGQMMGQPQQMNQGQMMGQPQQMNQGQMMGQPQQMNQGQSLPEMDSKAQSTTPVIPPMKSQKMHGNVQEKGMKQATGSVENSVIPPMKQPIIKPIDSTKFIPSSGENNIPAENAGNQEGIDNGSSTKNPEQKESESN